MVQVDASLNRADKQLRDILLIIIIIIIIIIVIVIVIIVVVVIVVGSDVVQVDASLNRADKQLRDIARRLATDKMIMCAAPPAPEFARVSCKVSESLILSRNPIYNSETNF